MVRKSESKNEKIISEFEKLLEQIKYEIDHSINRKTQIANTYRLKQIMNVIQILKKYDKEIKSGEQVKHLKGVGLGTVSRINEILEKGRLAEIKLDEEQRKYSEAINELKQIIGIGPRTAYDLVTLYNIKTIPELMKAYNEGRIELNAEILLGLKYHNVYQENIPREEIIKIDNFFEITMKEMDPDLIHVICGSYRRMKPISNDIDVLISHPKIKTRFQLESSPNYLRLLVENLRKKKFLVDDLTDKNFTVKYMGFCQYSEGKKKFPIRRIDMIYVPYDSFYAALLHFTGSGSFNEKIRSLAKELGYKLNEFGLFKLKNGETKIKISSEKDIFEKLGLEYIPPENR